MSITPGKIRFETVTWTDIHNAGNTNGEEIECLNCGEPWENTYIVEEMEHEYRRLVVLDGQHDDPDGLPTRIAALEQCPCCAE